MKKIVALCIVIALFLFVYDGESEAQEINSSIKADMIDSSTFAKDFDNDDEGNWALNLYRSKERLNNGTLEKVFGNGISTKATANSWAKSKVEEAIGAMSGTPTTGQAEVIGSDSWSNILQSESQMGATPGGLGAFRKASGDTANDTFEYIFKSCDAAGNCTDVIHRATASGAFEREDSVTPDAIVEALVGAEEDLCWPDALCSPCYTPQPGVTSFNPWAELYINELINGNSVEPEPEPEPVPVP